MAKGYDGLYQEWVRMHQAGNYAVADAIRERYEKLYGVTIIAEGEMPIEGETVKRMSWSAYEKKHGDPEVGEIMATQDSKVRHDYPGTPQMGYYGS